MKRPVHPVTMPADLKGQKNGRVAPHLLVSIGNGRLHHLAADAWHAMKVTAEQDGILLRPTSPADCYRTYLQQQSAFLSRYRKVTRPVAKTARAAGLEVKVWEGEFYVKKKGVATSAVPGTSNHGWGLAVDVADASWHRLEWLQKNALRFGFSWEFRSGAEPWHIRYYVGDKVPPDVISTLVFHPRPE
jgi:LAS superfamily LD-carboxypeptidase LdcB